MDKLKIKITGDNELFQNCLKRKPKDAVATALGEVSATAQAGLRCDVSGELEFVSTGRTSDVAEFSAEA